MNYSDFNSSDQFYLPNNTQLSHRLSSQETCLMRITTGLLEFQIYLEYLENKFEGNAKAMQMRTKALVLILQQRVSVSSFPHLVWGRQAQRKQPRQLGNAKPIQEMAMWKGKDLRNSS